MLLPAVTQTSILASWNSDNFLPRSWVVSDILPLPVCWEDSVGWECLNMAFPPHVQYLWHHITTIQVWYNKKAPRLPHLMQIWGQLCRWNELVSHISEHIKECHCYLWPCHAQCLLLFNIQPYHNHWIQSDKTLALTKVLHYIIGVIRRTIKINLCQNLSIW